MNPGTYRTSAGSIVTLSGAHGGIAEVEFDWFEESDACIDCVVNPYPDDGYLTWDCEECGGGHARLEEQR